MSSDDAAQPPVRNRDLAEVNLSAEDTNNDNNNFNSVDEDEDEEFVDAQSNISQHYVDGDRYTTEEWTAEEDDGTTTGGNVGDVTEEGDLGVGDFDEV